VKNSKFAYLLCIAATASLIVIQPIKAAEKPSTQAADLLAQTADPASTIQVTGVRLNPTDKGIEIILKTAQGATLQPEASKNSNTTFFAEIPNAVLALPDGKEFRVENPVTGIKTVTVTQLEGNVIQIQAIGENTVPTVAVKSEPVPVAEEPDEGEEEVVVTGDRPPDYRRPNTSTATGTDIPIMETPFSVQVVPKEVIRDQQATRIEEALRIAD
jgi:iron complex outermembrane recepter protein